MRFDERPVRAGEFAERMQRFHHARALRPAAAHAGGQRDHGEFAARDRGETGFTKFLCRRLRGIQHIRVLHVLDVGAGGQAVLRDANAAIFQIVANLFVLHAVEAVLFEQLREAVLAAVPGFQPGQQAVEQSLHHAGKFRPRAAGGAEAVQFRALGFGQRLRIGAQPARDMQCVVTTREQRVVAAQQVRPRAALVDGKIINHRFHREGQGVFQLVLGLRHDRLQSLLRLGLALRIKNKTHAAAGHAAEHPETPEVRAEFRLHGRDERFGERIAGPRNDGLERLAKIARGQSAHTSHLPGFERRHDFVQQTDGLLAAGPFGAGTEQIFFRHHLENRPDVLRHAAMDEHEALLQPFAGSG